MNSNPALDEQPRDHSLCSDENEDQDINVDSQDEQDMGNEEELDDKIDEYDDESLVTSRNEAAIDDEIVSMENEPYAINVEEEPRADDEINPSNINLGAYNHLLFKLINKRRKAQRYEELFENIGLKTLAAEHSDLVKRGNSDEAIDNALVKYDYRGKYEKIALSYEFEGDNELKTSQFDTYLLDCLNLLFELEEEHSKLFSTSLNSMGVGLSLGDNCMHISVFISYVPIAVESIRKNAMNRLEIIGRVLEEDKGLYAIRLVNLGDPSVAELITFQNIIFDLSTLKFVIEADFAPEIENSNKLVEFYLKTDPESIKYGYKTKIKYLSKAYEVNMKIPLQIFPTHSITQSNLVTKSLNNSEVFDPMKNINAIKKSFSIQQNELGRSVSDMPSEVEDMEPSKYSVSQLNPRSQVEEVRRASIKQPEEQVDNSISEFYFENNSFENRGHGEMYNDANLRVELETAIHQALQEIKKQISVNKKLQTRLATQWEKTGIKIYATEDNNDGINEIKYHNALALINQIRKELETVKSKYDKAADEMNTKLEEKVANCEKIKKAFNDLRDEIATKAFYETSLKKIPATLLYDLEEEERATNNTYQQLRLELIKTRIGLEKNQRGVREEEQLAEGLHLIDFEKLKIENQSLNEKLEERNEEIFKLQKKNNVNVQILSHLRQKLQFDEREVKEMSDTFDDKSRLTRHEVQTAKVEAAGAGERAQQDQAEDAQAQPGDRHCQEQIPQERLHPTKEEYGQSQRRESST